jgi:hypothetical protein
MEFTLLTQERKEIERVSSPNASNILWNLAALESKGLTLLTISFAREAYRLRRGLKNSAKPSGFGLCASISFAGTSKIL